MFAQVAKFQVSDAEALKELPPGLFEQAQQRDLVFGGEPTYYDLKEPWLSSAG